MAEPELSSIALEPPPGGGDAELRWPGKRAPTQVVVPDLGVMERHGGSNRGPANRPANRLIEADNLDAAGHLLASVRGQVKLIYLDPPFDSRANYNRTIQLRGPRAGRVTLAEVEQYRDRWAPGDYLQFIYERVIVLRELLRPDGFVWLHCDQHRSHHLRALLDEVFGPSNFVNEIHWQRAKTVKGNAGQGATGLGSNVDSLLVYRRSDAARLAPLFLPYSPEYIEAFFRFREADGRRYRLTSMTGPGGAAKANPSYPLMGVTRYWRYSEARMAALVAEGRVVQTRPGAVPQRKQYLDEGRGVALQSLWTDLPGLAARDAERVGYPTQKPVALLRRILELSTDPGERVVDGFCGSGTTAVAALGLDRPFVAIDPNPGAIQTARRRVLEAMMIEGELSGPALELWGTVAERGASSPSIELRRRGSTLEVRGFNPGELLGQLAGAGVEVEDWRELVDALLIEEDGDGRGFAPRIYDLPGRGQAVRGEYELAGEGRVCVQITDLLGQRWWARS